MHSNIIWRLCIKPNFKYSPGEEEGEMPPPRGNDLTIDVDESASIMLDGLRTELWTRGMGPGANYPPTSPVMRAEARSRDAEERNATDDAAKTNTKHNKSKTTVEEEEDNVGKKRRNKTESPAQS